ncbi:hypothetical protein T440DRAFT_497058 [Plenodomus tracheiphilus IPT5]|uniref:Rhodopsin domain-containing protein n=1 Tax=Plenodomus tracheiphilus IPT5 TaxID=1408161 RepID=A0A6A7BF72_9PLEO|nr:hypothetical protein T440DRAFT_497058 [Plenodomus tracheiphilus IPT5]
MPVTFQCAERANIVYCCVYVLHKWRADDYMSVIAGLTLVGALAIWQMALLLGCGGEEPNRCNYFSSDGDLVEYLYVMSVYYSVMHFLIKGTFLTFFLRLSPNRKFRLCVGVGYGLNIGMLITNMFFIVFQCFPISAAWNTLARIKAQCINQQFSVHGPDIFIFVLPIPIGVISVFAFGGAAVIMGLIRFHSLIAVQSLFHTSSGIGEIIIVAALELNLAIIAVNLPAIRSIWVKRSAEGSRRTRPAGHHSGVNEARSYTTSRGSKRATESREMSRISKTTLPSTSVTTESREELWRAEIMGKDGAGSAVTHVEGVVVA